MVLPVELKPVPLTKKPFMLNQVKGLFKIFFSRFKILRCKHRAELSFPLFSVDLQ